MNQEYTPHMILRIVVLSAVLAGGAIWTRTASRTAPLPPRTPLAQLPSGVGVWSGRDGETFTPAVVQALGVHEYVNRVYQTAQDRASLYIGYYADQQQGASIHSPLNCLPGAGWESVSQSHLGIPVKMLDENERDIVVNRYVVQKGLEQYVVLYWYQSHGRVIANEYRSKIFMVYDAIRLHRTDAALVRVMSRRVGVGPDAEAAASARGVAFVKALFPLLGRYLPA